MFQVSAIAALRARAHYLRRRFQTRQIMKAAIAPNKRPRPRRPYPLRRSAGDYRSTCAIQGARGR